MSWFVGATPRRLISRCRGVGGGHFCPPPIDFYWTVNDKLVGCESAGEVLVAVTVMT